MSTIAQILDVQNVNGVDQYLLVDPEGCIVDHQIDDPDKMSEVTFNSARTALSIGKQNFKYLHFSRKSHADFYVFPVGKYSLGVIKTTSMDHNQFVGNMVVFFNRLLNK